MGFFSKIFKGVKKVFKKIGKGIKSAFKKFGKFMNKIGVVGQIAMMFILPGIGNALASGVGSALGLQGVQGMSTLVSGTSGAGGLLGSSSAVLRGAGQVIKYAGKVASMPSKVFNSITSGIKTTITEFSKTLGSKLGLKGEFFANASDNFFGEGSAFEKSAEAFKAPFTPEQVASAAEKATVELDTIEQPPTSTSDGFMKASNTVVGDPSSTFESSLSPSDVAKTVNSASIKDFEALGFKIKGDVGDVGFKFGDNEMFINTESLSKLGETGLDKILQPYQTGEQYQQKSLLSRATSTVVEGIKGLPEKGIQEAKSFFDDPFDNLGEKITKGVQSKSLQALGLEDKPMAPVYNQYAAYVPSFDTAPQGSYGAPEIMNARSFEQQVSNNPNPFGYTAFQYNQYMNQYTTA